LLVGILLVISLLFAIRVATNAPLSPAPAADLVHPEQVSEVAGSFSSSPLSSNVSGYEFWFSGLPPNVSAPFVFGQFGPHGGWYASGRGEDGFGGGGGPLNAGVYDLYVQPAPGFIPVPASATYFVSAAEILNVSVSFVPAQPCYQVFTEVGLPQGTEWWVIGAGGVAFFANNSVIDTTGCGGLNGVTIGSSIGYQLVQYPPSAFYPSGAAIPVFFVPPGASVSQFPAAVVVTGIIVGSIIAIAYVIGHRRRGRAEGGEPSRPAATSGDLRQD
jgi:hypothetical protein